MKLQENTWVELEQEYTANIKKTVIAFANTDGGDVYIGITDSGRVIGLENTDEVMLQVMNMIRDAIRPDIRSFVQCETIKIEGKCVIKVTVQRGVMQPYYLANKGISPLGVYKRVGPVNQPMLEDEIRRMIIHVDNIYYENLISQNQQLSFEWLTKSFRNNELEFGEAQKQTLGILNSDLLYTNVGLLLSDQCKHTIKVAIFQGKTKEIFKDRKEFSGSIIKQLDRISEYLELSNRKHGEIEGLYRIDQLDYPRVAIREALINVITHRDYSVEGSAFINLYDDRLEFTSIGGLIQNLTLPDIMLSISKSRNPKVADIFYRLKLIEAYGTGIGKIKESYKNFVHEPIFTVTTGAFQVVLFNRNYVDNTTVDQEFLIKENPEDYILTYLQMNPIINRLKVEQLLDVKRTKAGKILQTLEQQEKIISTGHGKSRKYMLNRRSKS